MIRLNNDWEFVYTWTDGFGRGEGSGERVRLPHTVRELPLHYADSADYETVSGYRRRLVLPEGAGDGRVFLQFDGAAHIATVYLNGRELATHRCGYTAFRVEITDAVGEENLLAVKLDSTENPAIPPFGFLIDYLTYGGLYRDVWLDLRPRAMISDLFVHTPDLHTARVSWTLDGAEEGSVLLEILTSAGETVARAESAPGERELTLPVPAARPWTLDDPALYTLRATLIGSGDTVSTTFGFRQVDFRADGFFLNGEKVFLRGLDRHQAYPYMGYAAPERLQREDARILKRELACNAVRTSHYPQSRYFIDECDRQGILVFTEIPGWQHIGDAAWQDQAVENVREMVTQYRNHPSVVLWGVRINESHDNDPFYRRTNALAHALDPSRPTSGVRCIVRSHLLEDVYAYNDFSHNGSTPGVRPKAEVCPDDMDKPLLISECNGHMFPTKPYDHWSKRQQHALRHARTLCDAMADGDHLGLFAWCMFDYPTHRDFGSGDRICYHGVLDSFRNPKLAAYVYASQGEERPVLALGSSMDIGDYAEGKVDCVYAFTNAPKLVLYKNGEYVSEFVPGAQFAALPHPPIHIDDTVGVQLETKEGFDKAKADAVRPVLISAGRYGFERMPEADRAAMETCMERFHLSFQELYALYGRYVGNWGDRAPTWRLDAVEDGAVTASVTCAQSSRLHLEAAASGDVLTEGEVYDVVPVRIRVLDEYGNLAPYAQLPVRLELTGPAQLIGPGDLVAEGGSTGTYVRTTGAPGQVTLTVSTPQTAPVTLRFTVVEG